MSFYRRYRGFGMTPEEEYAMQVEIQNNAGIANALRTLGRLQVTNFFDTTPAQQLLNLAVAAYSQWLGENNLAFNPDAKLVLYAQARAKKEADAAAEKAQREADQARAASIAEANRAANVWAQTAPLTAMTVFAPAPIVAAVQAPAPRTQREASPRTQREAPPREARPTGQREVIPGSTQPLGPNSTEPSPPSGGTAWTRPRPAHAWDQELEPELEEIALPDGTTALVEKKSPLLAIAAGAGGGFFLGGPIGALVGAAAGYFVSRPRLTSAQIAFYRR